MSFHCLMDNLGSMRKSQLSSKINVWLFSLSQVMSIFSSSVRKKTENYQESWFILILGELSIQYACSKRGLFVIRMYSTLRQEFTSRLSREMRFTRSWVSVSLRSVQPRTQPRFKSMNGWVPNTSLPSFTDQLLPREMRLYPS